MTTDAGDFAKKVKGVVRKNFNQSAQIYRAFEEKHHFFYTLTRKLAEWMDLQSQSRVLDIGCGNGISCEALRELYDATVFGIDLSEAMIEDGVMEDPVPDLFLAVHSGPVPVGQLLLLEGMG